MNYNVAVIILFVISSVLSSSPNENGFSLPDRNEVKPNYGFVFSWLVAILNDLR